MTYTNGLPTCDGQWAGCELAVSHIDEKGYIYCTPCGHIRQETHRCRKLRPHELRKIQRGEALARY